MLPLLKWTGGKRKLTSVIKQHMPTDYHRYYEPFVGGGALFFELEKPGSYISDINIELINFYEQVRDNPLELLELSDTHINDKEYYNEVRNWDRQPDWNTRSNLERAARFLYLNKTSYSGMWRVNKNNQMNVPFAGYKSARLSQATEKYVDKEHLLAASNLLKETEIQLADYDNINPEVNDLVYFDPPYDATFDGYTSKKLSQEDLRDFVDTLECYVLVSNSNTDTIHNLYSHYNIIYIDSKQSISGYHNKGDKRPPTKEVLISNDI